MDELLHHCLRELSFDGDLGCDVSRLRDFIVGFYTHNHASHRQTVDDAFYAFVWSVVVQNPTVCVGTIPPGAATEVYIAPQTSAKRKAKAKGEELVDGPTPSLDILADAKFRSLNDLKKEYGDNLRIAVDQETSFAAITGSHIRSSKLSPMVYTTLQLITRGRENGISVVDLGRKSGYDQKTCFYLVKQLVQLGHIVKVRRGGVGTHFCIHKYFYERSPLWQQIRDEELQAENLQNPSREYQSAADNEHGEGDNKAIAIEFDPIDARHLSSLPLVRARVIKLLKGSKNHMQPCNNMLLSIGFSNPTKTDRRFFQSRIREIIQQGLIEKVIVPNNNKRDFNSTIKCFRLVTSEDSQCGDGDGVIVQPQLGDEEKDEGVFDDQSGIKTSLTIHKQIVDLLEEAGTAGMTLSELSVALCHFDKRTIELLLTRAEKVPHPPHLNDLGIVGLMETHGRERRNRYFTIASYRTLVTQENLDESTARYSNVDLHDVGGFIAIGRDVFYEDEKMLFKYQDEFNDQERARTGGKPRKYPLKNPILPDGTVKQGRPKGSTKKKQLPHGEAYIQLDTKRKRDDGDNVDEGDEGDEPDQLKGSRPAKKRRLNGGSDSPAKSGGGGLEEPNEGAAIVTWHSQVDFATLGDTGAEMSHPETRPKTTGGEAGQASVPKKRGRPPKRKFDVTGDRESAKGHAEIAVLDGGDSVPPKKRGRPPKQKPMPSNEQEPDQLGRKGGNAQARNEYDGPTKKKLVTRGTGLTENRGPSVSVQPLPEVQPQTIVHVEGVVGELQSSSVDAETAASQCLPSDDMPIDYSGRTLGSEIRHEGEGHETYLPPVVTWPPTVQHVTSSCSESVRAFSEQQPRDVEHGIAHGDAFDDQSRQPNLLVTVLPPDITIDSLGSPTAGKSIITQQRSHTSTTINPNLIGETGDAGASASLYNNNTSDFAARTNQTENPITEKAVPNDLKGNQPFTDQLEDQTNVASRPRVNVSNLRRENELVRVIEDLGGVVNYHTKEFFDAHSLLIKTMFNSGEPTSAPPDVRLDKRTANTTLSNMENRGRVKTLKTSVTTPTGLSRPACVVYLPNIAQDKINVFLGNLSCGSTSGTPQPIKKIDKRMEYGSDSNQIQRNPLPLQLLQMERLGDDRQERRNRNAAKAEQLFNLDDATLRDVLLTEKTTLGQLYGFIVSKALRARELHLSTISAFEAGTLSLNIVSPQHRIVHFSYFFQDLSVSTYCALVSTLNYSEELTQFLATEVGPRTSLREIPHNLYNTVLQVGRSRSRSRLLDTLEILRSLKLVTPLQPNNSATPSITCLKNGEHPTAFEVASMEGWTVNTALSTPVYWRFNTSAPLHLWALSETPPFLKDVFVLSHADAEKYWQELRETCTNRDYLQPNTDSIVDSVTGPLDASIAAARSLRRTASWSNDYFLTWHQSQYLMRFVDASTGNTPLQNEAGQDAQIRNICMVISAPIDAVTDFLMKAHAKIIRELDRTRRKTKLQSTAAKSLLHQKAADARAQRERDWESMVLRVHAEPLKGPAAVRVRRVRSRFLQSGSAKDIEKWEIEITEATREATMPVTKALVGMRRPQPSQRVSPPPFVSVSSPENSIGSLIAQQGPSLPRQMKKRKKTKNQDRDQEEVALRETSKKGSLRRHRFQWNGEYDELARDASAIIRARCRNGQKLDWGAFEQVFPAVPRNSVRQRLVHIREAPGNEAYLDRLEDRWYDLWLQHRGTALLPDDDPQSLSNFNLIKHIEFLRAHIDKNAIRVGFGQHKENTGPNLSASVDQLLSDWDILESVHATPEFDFMWSANVEDGREKSLLRHAITTHVDDLSLSICSSSELQSVAESALKMTFGTPHESYDSDAAARFLRNFGEQTVSQATITLINRGILSKTVRDPQKSKPGRTLKISEINQNAIGGSIPRDTFQDAVTLEDICTQQEGLWREWPLLATEGDIATLLQLVSDRKVEFKIDTSQPQMARQLLDWNSKKADDDQIETAIFVQFHNLSGPAQQPLMGEPSPPLVLLAPGNETSNHGDSVDGGLACCRKESDGVVDCQSCIEEEHSNFTADLNDIDKELALHILATVRAAGAKGITNYELLTTIHASDETIYSLVRRMANTSVPLVFWSGYETVVLVSSLYLQPWTVVVSEKPRTRIFPRRWFGIAGLKMSDVWEAALKAVVGVVLFRPGISQAELRWRLRSVYDRQEVHDIICHLQQEGIIKSRRETSIQDMTVLDDWEEKTTFWFIGDAKHWYQV